MSCVRSSLPRTSQPGLVVSLIATEINDHGEVARPIRTDLMAVDKWLLQPASQHSRPLSGLAFIHQSEQRRVLCSNTLSRNGISYK